MFLMMSAAATTAACGGRPGAAEPASAPPVTHAPAGFTRRVGDHPEGIVYDPRSHLVAVAVRDPDRLLLLDPTTLAVERSVRLPGSARHLQLGPGDTVLVPAETANRLVTVALPSGRIVRETRTPDQPHDAAAAADGDVVVTDEFGKAITVIAPDGRAHTIADLRQPGGITTDGELAAVVDVGAFTVDTYDLMTRRRVAVAEAGSGPTHVVLASGHRLVVSDTRGNAVIVFDDSPLRRVGRLPLPGTPYGLALDRRSDTVWVTLTASNEVVGLNLSRDRPRIVARYATVRQPNTVAVQPGSRVLWVTGTDAGTVQRIAR